MMADVLAIQELYGIMELCDGANACSFEADIKPGPSLTVADSNGIDRLGLSWSKVVNVIDLHEEVSPRSKSVKANLAIVCATVRRPG